MNNPRNRIELCGLRGDDLLGFLSALGLVRILEYEETGGFELGWSASLEAYIVSELDRSDFTQVILARLNSLSGAEPFTWHDNILATQIEFRNLLRSHIGNEQRILFEDLLASLATEGFVENDEYVADTKFRTMRGAGHQHFLMTIRHVFSETTLERLEKTLFEDWDFSDPVTNSTLRLSPNDDRRHAYQWKDPSKETTEKSKSGGMIAANALAAVGISFFPVIPFQSYSQTTGFMGRKASDCFFRWPVWTRSISPQAIGTLLAQTIPDDASERKVRGIQASFESQRLTIGKVRNFTPAKAI